MANAIKISGLPYPFALNSGSAMNGSEVFPADQVVGGVRNTVGLTAAQMLTYFGGGGGGSTQFIEAAGWNSSSAPITLALTVPQDVIIPYACTLQQVYITTQGASGGVVSGSCTVTIGQAAFPGSSFTDITGGSPPTIGSGSSYSNTALTGWTTSLAQNAQLRIALTAVTGFYSVKIHLRLK